jgi:rhamnosyl/mannosyltransferase
MPAAPRLRVLHAYKTYLPDTEGGIPSAIRSLAPACEGLVLATRRPFAPRRIEAEGMPVLRVAAFGEALSLPLAPLYPLALRRAARQADLVALHTPFPLGDLGLAITPDAPLVIHWHADIVRQRRAARLLAPLIRRTLARAARIIVSDGCMVAASPWLAPVAGTCVVVPYGVEAADWAEMTAAEAAEAAALRAAHPRLVAAVGRLVGYKGFDVLVEAAARLDAQVVIAGEGPGHAALAARIAARPRGAGGAGGAAAGAAAEGAAARRKGAGPAIRLRGGGLWHRPAGSHGGGAAGGEHGAADGGAEDRAPWDRGPDSAPRRSRGAGRCATPRAG